MDGIQFEADQHRIYVPDTLAENSGLVGWCMKRGLAKNREKAVKLLAIVGAVLIFVSIAIFSVYATDEEYEVGAFKYPEDIGSGTY